MKNYTFEKKCKCGHKESQHVPKKEDFSETKVSANKK